MEDFELSVDGERFRISEQRQPHGKISYSFTWLNGPAAGTYGFTLGLVPIGQDVTIDEVPASLSSERLIEEVRHFVDAFYAPGGIRDEDFPSHAAAANRHIAE